MFTIIVSSFLCSAVLSANYLDLATFDGAKKTTFTWRDVNDPVMGGRSSSQWTINTTAKFATWDGTVRIVPSLRAPGFCNAETTNGLGIETEFPDASAFTHISIRARSFKPYDGYKLSFAADTWDPQFASFKSNFNLTSDGSWHVVSLPWSAFSNNWSPFTGDCDTKDPTGRQHHCCSPEHPEVCPTKTDLSKIQQLGFWVEGHVGDFHMDVEWVRATYGDTCAPTDYCCPDAQACLTPSRTSCATNSSVCQSPQFCCPLTKLCVTKHQVCTTPCQDANSYCCPDAKRCLTPNPGKSCKVASDCAGARQTCCPITHECVEIGPVCNPFDSPNAPFWPPKK